MSLELGEKVPGPLLGTNDQQIANIVAKTPKMTQKGQHREFLQKKQKKGKSDKQQEETAAEIILVNKVDHGGQTDRSKHADINQGGC